MARRCFYCEKGPVTGNKISHSNIKTKVRHMPNLQKVRASVEGLTTRVYACTRCLRSGILTRPLFLKRASLASDKPATA